MAELLELQSTPPSAAFGVCDVMSDVMNDTRARMRIRRTRTRFTDEDIALLSSAFSGNPYPDFDVRQLLADRLNVPESRIAVWFQNKRTRMRKANGLEAGTPGPHTSRSPNVFKTSFESESASPHDSSANTSIYSPASQIASSEPEVGAETSPENSSPLDLSSSAPRSKKLRVDSDLSSPSQSPDSNFRGEDYSKYAEEVCRPLRISPERFASPLTVKIEPDTTTDCQLSPSRLSAQHTAIDLSMPYPHTMTSPPSLFMPMFNVNKLRFEPYSSMHYLAYLRSLAYGYSMALSTNTNSQAVFPDSRP